MLPKKVLKKRLLPEPGKSKDTKILEEPKAKQTRCLVCEDETDGYEALFAKGNARAGSIDNVLELLVLAMISLVSQPCHFSVCIVH